MYTVEQELNSCTIFRRFDADRIYIADLADVHVGSSKHHEKEFERTIEAIKKIPNFYVIIGGDSTESSGIHTKSSVFDESTHGIDQILKARDVLKPIKDRILFIRSGNHGAERAYKNNKLPPEHVLAELLEIPYFRGFGAAIINARKNTYVIGTQHNTKKPEQVEWLHADAVFFEHKHIRGYHREPVATVNRFTKKWIMRDRLAIQSGSFLAWGGYAKDKGYRPQYTGCPILEVSGIRDTWDMRVYERLDDFLRSVVPKESVTSKE